MSSTHLIVLSIIGWGVGSLLYKVANDNIHPLMVSIIVTSVFVVLDIITLAFIPFDRTLNSTGIIYSILGGLCMCAGSLGYFFALRGGNAGSTTVLTSLYPAVTLILAAFFLKENITFKHGIGMAFAMAAIILMSSK